MQKSHDHSETSDAAKSGEDRARFGVGDEFPADYFEDRSITRRAFLAGLSAAIALTASGCKRKSNEAIVPYVRQPVGTTPGRPLHFATSMTLSGYGQGVIATSREGRPIKLDGNPDHPASLGGSDVFMQEAIYDLYDPDRAQAVLHLGVPNSWDQFAGALSAVLEAPRSQPANIAILSENITSPTLLQQIAELRKSQPGLRWYVHDPMSRETIRAGLRQVIGRAALPRYDFAKAKVVVSLDCDFLLEEPGHLRYARDFADGRRIRSGTREMNRLYVLESTSTITGTQADHRWALKPSGIGAAANELLGAMSVQAPGPSWATYVATDLLNHRGSTIVLAGAEQPAVVHRLVHQINDLLGNIGKTVFYDAPVPSSGDGDLMDLTAHLNGGDLDVLLILGGNPVYTAPADVDFAGALKQFSLRATGVTARLGLYDDETAELCQWLLPQTHFLEEWSDARAFDGTISLCQPLIDPLYNGRSAIETLEVLRTQHLHSGYEILREFWAKQQADDFENVWRNSLKKGVWIGTQPQVAAMESTTRPSRATASALLATPAVEGFEISFRPDPTLWDGSFANNAFLQELPKPITKLTWDNAAMLSAASAAQLGVETEDGIELSQGGRTLRCAACILPGQPDGAITLHLGGGRWRSGRAAAGAGFNANVLRTAGEPWLLRGAAVRKTGETYRLAATRTHQTLASRHLSGVNPMDTEVIERPDQESIDNRKLVRVAPLEQFVKDPDVIRKMGESESHSLTLYPGYESTYEKNFKWGMSIDMQSCIGCSACVAACQTENNISVVGKDQVLRGREMHWIRVDTYFAGPEEAPTAAFNQPIPCMQCENAPCELVCPVGATVHDDEGINDMVYDRVGTRYCSNNCPYKVRRFNFLQYADDETESLKLMRNPEVTVRTRGVMEKCTYCIQRITATRIDMELAQAKAEQSLNNQADPEAVRRRQSLLDQLETACQQACPTKAIVFGNINPAMEPIRTIDATHLNEVTDLKQQPHNYTLLEDLTTRPRTSYLARIVNPNPALAGVEGPA